MLIGVGDGALNIAQLAEAGDETLGRLQQLLGRARENRIDGGATAQGTKQHLAQILDFLQQRRIGLREIPMNEILQIAGLALQ